MAKERKHGTWNGYTVRNHNTYGLYVRASIENVQPGWKLDMGEFAGYSEVKGNDKVWDVLLADGYKYTETRGARVRVWI